MKSTLVLSALAALATAHSHHKRATSPQDALYSAQDLTINSIPPSTRIYWMRRANAALADLSTPCPFAAFATVIVNHTDTSTLGTEICIGINSNSATGNPTLHGEMAAIANCTAELQGARFNLTAAEALAAFQQLSLYTNAESCPMCASAIRWAGFREYIYGTTIDFLVQKGWGQIRIASSEVFRESYDLPTQARLMGEVLTNETDGLFAWQYDAEAPCPAGCARGGASGGCVESGS